MRLGRLLLRATVGGFFIGHGTQKLTGAFGGHGLGATAQAFESMGLKPGKVHAGGAAAAETFGGAGILLGYRTPLASSAIVAAMLTAINRVHLKNGPWVTNGGYEYNAVLIAAAVALAEMGPGVLSLDALRGKEREGAVWGLFALGAGTAGAAAAHLLAESRADKEAPEATFSTEPPAEPAPTDAPVVTQNPTGSEQPVPASPSVTTIDPAASAADGAPGDMDVAEGSSPEATSDEA